MSELHPHSPELASPAQVQALYDLVVGAVADHGTNHGHSDNIFNIPIDKVPENILSHFPSPLDDIDDVSWQMDASRQKDWRTQKFRDEGSVASVAVQQTEQRGDTKYVTRLSYWFERNGSEGTLEIRRRISSNDYGPHRLRGSRRLLGAGATTEQIHEQSFRLLQELKAKIAAYETARPLEEATGVPDVTRDEIDELIRLAQGL